MFSYRIVLLGAGRVGQALATSLSTLHPASLHLWNRRERPELREMPETVRCLTGAWPEEVLGLADLVLLTIRDDALEEVAGEIAPLLRPETVLAHCSGVTPLTPLFHSGHPEESCGIVHPLQAIATGTRKPRLFESVWVGVEGGNLPVSLLSRMVEHLGGHVFSLKGVDRALYHAAAVVSANYLVTLASLSEQIARQAGVSEPALAPFLPLMQTALTQLQQKPPQQALTGPIARGDTEVVATHWKALAALDPELAELYALLARQTLPLVAEEEAQTPERWSSLRLWLENRQQD